MTIAQFDQLDIRLKRDLLLTCCSSHAWIDKVLAALPAEDLVDLLEIAEEKWYECNEAGKTAMDEQNKIIKQKLENLFAA